MLSRSPALPLSWIDWIMEVWIIISCFPLGKVKEQGKACSWQNFPGYLEVNMHVCIYVYFLLYYFAMYTCIKSLESFQIISIKPFSCFILCFLTNVKPIQEAMHHSDRHSCYAHSSYSVLGLVKVFLPTLTPLSDLDFKTQFQPSAFTHSLHGSFQKSPIREK